MIIVGCLVLCVLLSTEAAGKDQPFLAFRFPFAHMQLPLYSIGHGTRKAEEFIGLLLRHSVKILVDVRSYPYSRFNPHFNRKALQNLLEEHGIKYVFMGDTLGGRPMDEECYTNGKINYDVLRQKDFFQRGLNELINISQNATCAVMCSERKPQDCHRSKLIGPALPAGLDLLHIDEKNVLKTQADLGKPGL